MSDLFNQVSELDNSNKFENQNPESKQFEQRDELTETKNSNANLNISLPAKELTKQIDWINTHRKVEYLQDVVVLLKHKSVSIRRAAVKCIENIGDKSILPVLRNNLESEADRQTLILLENTIDRIERGSDELVKSRNIYQVAEFLHTIKILIGSKSFVIEGEVSEVNIYHQVVYFSLKDKDSEERLDCLAYYSILNRLDFTLNNGLSVRITGKAGLSKGSRLRVQVSFIQLTGEGEFLRNLKLLQTKLEKEGLFDPERKRKLATLPRKIILMVSKGSAAETDFIKILNERRQGIEICIVPIKTQGDSALEILYSSLQFVQSELETSGSYLSDSQAVVITRGGGSTDDLNVFNQEQIVRAIHGLKIPTVVAIGHEKDWSLAEMAADFRASTPTQAAIAVSWSAIETKANVDVTLNQIRQWFLKKQESYHLYSDRMLQMISRSMQKQITEIDQMLRKHEILTQNFIYTLRREYENLRQLIRESIFRRLDQMNKQLLQSSNLDNYLKLNFERSQNLHQQACDRIKRNISQRLKDSELEFRFLVKNIDAFDTKKVLKRGFAILTDPISGKVIEKWAGLSPVHSLSVTLQDGERLVKLENDLHASLSENDNLRKN